MYLIVSRLVVPLLVSSFFTLAAASLEEGQNLACMQIGASISPSSNIYYPGDPLYAKGIKHWASSSSQLAKCVVEPGTAADVGIILGVVGKTKTPFAVKGGGHASNPKFSSTTGVHISMYRFADVVYDPGSQTADIGAGLVWDDVYAALEPHGVNVVGGRVPSVGVAGLTLGGGYSWKSNQYGLTIDTVTAFELVKPDGNVVTVTNASDPDLFFGLKGGFNNFGIVTKFTMRTFSQTQVWGGKISTDPQHAAEVTAATVAFASRITDPKACMINDYIYPAPNTPLPQNFLSLFYDGPNPPPGIFDDFLAIPSLAKDISTRSFLSLVHAFESHVTPNSSIIRHTLSVPSLTPSFLDAVLNETNYWGSQLTPKSGTVLAIGVQPFISSLYSHNSDSTAFPPVRSKGFIPLDIGYEWTDETFDEDFHNAARSTATQLSNAAQSEGQSLQGMPLYPNYAIYGTPLEAFYGDNLPRLRSLQSKVDPHNVMALAGGWKF